jgi:hypothetical protein
LSNHLPVASAEQLYYALEEEINSQSNNLEDDEALHITAPLQNGSLIRVQEFGFRNWSLILIYGVDDNGNDVTLYVSHTNFQINVTTVKLKPEEPRREIGFKM